MTRFPAWVFVLLFCLSTSGCISLQINLPPGATDPLKEYRLTGTEKGKIAVIPIKGFISEDPDEGMLRTKPGMIQEVVSQLDLARADNEVGAVLLKIDSPGGTITASDILYHEINRFKTDTGKKVVVTMMNYAASGGYYISLPADYIIAHPTTVTGSVGVLMVRPNIHELMDKVGVKVEVYRSGMYKDMGSFLRSSTENEDLLFESLVESFGNRFFDKVIKHRTLSEEAAAEVKTGRIYLAEEAKSIGLVDGVGYLNEAVDKARELAGLHENCKVVIYRRAEFADDNIYNPVTMSVGPRGPSLADFGLPRHMLRNLTGFYYLWIPGLENG